MTFAPLPPGLRTAEMLRTLLSEQRAQLACAMILDVASRVRSDRLGAPKSTPIALQDAVTVTHDGQEARALPAQPRPSRHPRVQVLRLRPAPPRARPIVPSHSTIACHLLQGWVELTAQHARLKSRRKKCLNSVVSVEPQCGRTPRLFAADAAPRASRCPNWLRLNVDNQES